MNPSTKTLQPQTLSPPHHTMAVARRLMFGSHFDSDEAEQQKDNLVYDSNNLQSLFSVSPISQPTSPIKVMQMATGYMHMAVVTTDGRVFTRGDGAVGQLGLGEEIKISYKFTEVDPVHFRSSAPHDKPIMVTCGLYFCTTLTTAGEVFTWGENGFGCLGLGLSLKDRRYEPQRVNFENVATSKLCMISSNKHHTLALGSGGELYAWGANANGQLGLGTSGPSRFLMAHLKNAGPCGSIFRSPSCTKISFPLYLTKQSGGKGW